MNDEQLLRYSRHILLDEVGIEGQTRLLTSHVLVIGAGGLGSPALLYLAAAGVGTVTVVDHDHVDVTNLQRQIAHNLERTGQTKVSSVKAAMRAINPDVTVHGLCQRATLANLSALVMNADVVLDCSDNFETRHAINAACVRFGKPLVSGSAIRMDGQLTVYHPAFDLDAPCYACVFPQTERHEEVACSTLGVLGPLVGVIGSMQAAEALKLLCNYGAPLIGRLLLVNARQMTFDEIKLKKNLTCSVCGT